MKKVVKLTESDLIKIVKRVIKEQGSKDPLAIIQDCIKQNTGITDIAKIPSECLDFFNGDVTKILSCSSKGGQEIINKVVDISTCVATKNKTMY